jgi:DNA-binding response OmpR family regulator
VARGGTILVVDDEPKIVDIVRAYLARECYRVLVAYDGRDALAVARRERPDLIVLDLMLPEVSGWDVCRTLRAESTVPIIMLTARDDTTDKIVGLELGADDYVTKPFSMRELIARVGSLLRRAELAPPAEREVIVAGDLQVDLRRREASRAGSQLQLKPKEYELLVFFLRNRGRAFTREQLLNQVWGYDFAGDTRTVDVHVSWLRQKIEPEPSKPVRLITVRGVGYRFD